MFPFVYYDIVGTVLFMFPFVYYDIAGTVLFMFPFVYKTANCICRKTVK